MTDMPFSLNFLKKHPGSAVKKYSFRGGIHPDEHKEITEDLPISDKVMDPDGPMVFPMQQHVGAPCSPLVKKGDKVLRDQIIGDTEGLGAPIYSSVSGTVTAVKPMPTPSGRKVMSVVVENDHAYTEIERPYPPVSYKELTKGQILDRIRYAGIVGMGGAGFPTHVKLKPPKDISIDYILINGSECEPYLTSDYRVMIEDPWRVVNGLRIALSLFDSAQGLLCIEDNKMKAAASLMPYIEGDDRIRILILKTKFPQGGEKQLIEAVTGRQVPSGGLPADVGCIVLNIDTSVAISRAVTQGRPLERRIVTLAGDCVRNPGNYRVRIGTPIRELVDKSGGLTKEPAMLICGGPMMGMTMDSLDVPVIKTTSCILIQSRRNTLMPKESACIRCGKCVEVCPMFLQPYKLNELVERRDFEEFIRLHGTDCIECGCCSYICPAKRHLTQSCRVGKQKAAELRRKGGTRQ